METLSVKHLSELNNLELLANQVVEGFITGMHKSPFHGFSVEFAEHRLYNKGESTRHIDWKLYAKTKKLFVKRYEEETNLRCHLIIDNSASMHYPIIKQPTIDNLTKVAFSAIASAALIEILKRQRDAVGLSVYSDKNDYYAPAKGGERHRRMLLTQLEGLFKEPSIATTDTYKVLHEISEKIHRRSLVFLFTDMFQTSKNEQELFEALRHLKHNKHEVVLFHTYDEKLEFNFDFENSPKKFVDVETGEQINMYASNVKKQYKASMSQYFNDLKMKCMQYKIDYVPVDINKGFSTILLSYLISRKKIL
ncbi:MULTISPECIES: DUF58 domain-containing protein [Flavobacteriaceae]|uniref:DUF58 domain-containing protein n=2 Tax=Flavobacteriaceae TaxID=49546 RepID=A0A4Y8AT42_9FLAO|nr:MULTISPECIES: DUF58 domain-containing protein [Flavobacteriaceae]TEW75061.1 DUF58 domain-containing protein [Gramella jeungdoensis]GGK41950.1 hypothetical protein GCM10007963_07420 [Lutibacter litoralis]